MKADKKRKIGTLVFDLDGTLETPYFDKEDSPKVRAWMESHPCGNTFERMYAEVMDALPHFFLNGAFEILQWAVDHGFEIVFFSNAVEERNRELCPILMERAFGKGKVPPYRILSRGDCVDTTYMEDEKQKSYQGLWRGNYKKKLAGVVVAEAALSDTLMIEDDNSYAVKGEEKNFVYGVYGGVAQMFIESPDLSSSYAQSFHLPFYFCGILNRIVTYAEKTKVSLAEAAVKVQYEDFGRLFPQDGKPIVDWNGFRVDTPYPPQENYRIFVEGLVELRKYNPDLRFWGDADEKAWRWPDPEAPKQPPPPEKPKIKTDMTRSEARYLLKVLRRILCMVLESNVKHVTLVCKDYSDSVSSSEMDSFSWRERNFDGEDYFDRKAVTGVSLYGYLPIRQESSEWDPYGDHEDIGTRNYRICLRIIEQFLWECFRIDVDWDKTEIVNVEMWKIPARPVIEDDK